MKSLRTPAILAVSLLLPMAVLAAGVFPDVGDNHPFKGEIESLVRAGIVKGNPDGKYYPDRPVNRAEFLKLLYVAAGRTPKTIYAKCFVDVEPESWYESFVCDAAAKENLFVQGYGDNTFRPGNPVSRTESLKMMFTVFGLNAPDIVLVDKDIIKFVDISTAAWYSKYVSAAYRNGVLPIYGFGGARFYPDQSLTRGEAAAYIFNGLKTRSAQPVPLPGTSGASSSSRSEEPAVVNQTTFPFNDTGVFQRRKPASYVFKLTDSKTIVSITAATTGNTPADITCRLYLIEDNDFSSEYYLGIQDGGTCRLTVAARPGTYQLQVQSTTPDMPYFVNAKAGSTDGNDGFLTAIALSRGVSMDAALEADDLFDWYSFTVDGSTEGTVFVTSPERLNCIVYTPKSVDQFGFAGPECGVEYFYATGQYTVGIGRKAGSDLSKPVNYTVRWK